MKKLWFHNRNQCNSLKLTTMDFMTLLCMDLCNLNFQNFMQGFLIDNAPDGHSEWQRRHLRPTAGKHHGGLWKIRQHSHCISILYHYIRWIPVHQQKTFSLLIGITIPCLRSAVHFRALTYLFHFWNARERKKLWRLCIEARMEMEWV